MLGLCLKTENDVWYNTTAVQAIAKPHMTAKEMEKYTDATDILLGFYGGAIQQRARAQKPQARDTYINKYIKIVKNRNEALRNGYEVSIVQTKDKDTDTSANVVTENTLGYIEGSFDEIETAVDRTYFLDTLQRIRTKIIIEQHIDVYVLMHTIVQQDYIAKTNERDTAAGMLRSLCITYNLQEFMSELLSCRDIVSEILKCS